MLEADVIRAETEDLARVWLGAFAEPMAIGLATTRVELVDLDVVDKTVAAEAGGLETLEALEHFP